MSKSTTAGRHRAAPVHTNPLETMSKAVSSSAGSVGRQAVVIAAATGLVLTVGAPAQAGGAQRDAAVQAGSSAPTRVQVETVKASNIQLKFERAGVTSTPAPVAEPVVEAEAAAEAAEQAAPVQAEAEAGAQVQAASVEKAEAKPEAAAASGLGASIVAAAYGQIGVSQDCTAMVENALRQVGFSVGDLAPAQFFAYGTQVSSPQPGDLIYYDDAGAGVPHIAIYVGNGQAIHGGWTGYTTVLGNAYIGSGPVFIRPSR
ncbi:C40 family peptidase [Arthrobacter sp. I2-34]|uniref:C40 family peptidase n=1 Tax=Arthrobacter hankyongi TaxID=2904801 RepID=A0ABS9L340_9MICC|nr:NlpC/P60 family protein [Arthrobacter hankyongi]MCG2621036.1 C40 family peptidase [Arthrobacter hankyongi]